MRLTIAMPVADDRLLGHFELSLALLLGIAMAWLIGTIGLADHEHSPVSHHTGRANPSDFVTFTPLAAR